MPNKKAQNWTVDYRAEDDYLDTPPENKNCQREEIGYDSDTSPSAPQNMP